MIVSLEWRNFGYYKCYKEDCFLCQSRDGPTSTVCCFFGNTYGVFTSYCIYIIITLRYQIIPSLVNKVLRQNNNKHFSDYKGGDSEFLSVWWTKKMFKWNSIYEQTYNLMVSDQHYPRTPATPEEWVAGVFKTNTLFSWFKGHIGLVITPTTAASPSFAVSCSTVSWEAHSCFIIRKANTLIIRLYQYT